jgi:hypothetical protein
MVSVFAVSEGNVSGRITHRIGLNPALAIILQKSKGLQNEKTGNIDFAENVSGGYADDWNRTSTLLLETDFESAASTGSATSAKDEKGIG